MNIPLINSNSKQDINTSLIAIRNAINELSRMKESASVEDLQRQINIINQQITNLQPVDTVASGNLHSVTSNAVFNSLFNASMPTFWQDDTRKDPLAVADMLATNWFTPSATDRFASFRLGHINSENSPYGNGNTDFYYHMYKLADGNWIKLIAYDVRDSRMYINTKTNRVWQGWESVHQYKIRESGTGFTEQYSISSNGIGAVTQCLLYGRGTLRNLGKFLSQIGFQGRSFQGVIGIEISASQTINYTVKNKFQNVLPSVFQATNTILYMTNPWIYFAENDLQNGAISWETFWEFSNVATGDLFTLVDNTAQVWLSISV